MVLDSRSLVLDSRSLALCIVVCTAMGFHVTINRTIISTHLRKSILYGCMLKSVHGIGTQFFLCRTCLYKHEQLEILLGSLIPALPRPPPPPPPPPIEVHR